MFISFFNDSKLLIFFIKIDFPETLGSYNKYRYMIVLPLTILVLLVNHRYWNKKLNSEDKLKELYTKYYRDKYLISVWVIFLTPVFIVFVCPIILGALNGTLSFPAFEK